MFFFFTTKREADILFLPPISCYHGKVQICGFASGEPNLCHQRYQPTGLSSGTTFMFKGIKK